MNLWPLITFELAVVGMLLCGFSIGSPGWHTADNSTLTSLWHTYQCNGYSSPSGYVRGAQACILLSFIVAIAEAVLIPPYLLISTGPHLNRILIVLDVFGYFNATMLSVGSFLLIRDLGNGNTGFFLAMFSAFLHLAAGTLISVVGSTRYFLNKLVASEDDHRGMLRLLTGLAVGLILAASFLVMVIFLLPRWRSDDGLEYNVWMGCLPIDGRAETHQEAWFKAGQALMIIGMLSSLATVALVTSFVLVPSDAVRTKLIKIVFILCFVAGLLVLVSLVTLGTQLRYGLSYSFACGLLSSITSLCICGIGVLRKIPTYD